MKTREKIRIIICYSLDNEIRSLISRKNQDTCWATHRFFKALNIMKDLWNIKVKEAHANNKKYRP